MTTALEDQIRAAFACRAERTAARVEPPAAAEPAAGPVLPISGRRPRRWRSLTLAAAAAIGAGAVGAVALQRGGGSADPTPTVPADATPIVPTIGDPLAINLDAAPRSAAAPSGVMYDVLDADAMVAAGWTVEDPSAYALLSPGGSAPDSYRFQATLESPDGLRFDLSIERGMVPSEPDPGDMPVDVGGDAGWISGESDVPTVRWPHGTALATLSTYGPDAEPEPLVAAAAAMRFVEADALPVGEPGPDADGQLAAVGADEAVLGGTLDGEPWAAEVDPGSLRTIRVTTTDGASATSSDRLSQPTDDPASGVELSITGVPGHGAIAYGWAPPAAAAVQAVAGDVVIGELPMFRRTGESFFAVPIPDGVVLDRLVFVGANGTVVAGRDLPLIPPGLGGTFGLG